MAKEKRLIDCEQAKRATYEEIFWTESEQAVVRNFLAKLPKVDAYTEEQLTHILNSLDKVEAENKELITENAWLKSCINCKIRKECPSHCGKVVHNCDHWEYGDNAVEVVHGRWIWQKDGEADYEQYWMCSECKDVTFFKTNYCPNCGAKMDGNGNG